MRHENKAFVFRKGYNSKARRESNIHHHNIMHDLYKKSFTYYMGTFAGQTLTLLTGSVIIFYISSCLTGYQDKSLTGKFIIVWFSLMLHMCNNLIFDWWSMIIPFTTYHTSYKLSGYFRIKIKLYFMHWNCNYVLLYLATFMMCS